MPIDGTYGRLRAHNQRLNELRRKKIERRENKLKQNSLSNTIQSGGRIERKTESIDPKKLERLKIEIRKKAKIQSQREYFIYLIILVLICILSYYLFFH